MTVPTLEENRVTTLDAKIRDKTARVAVIGIGYVGLPLAVAFADIGYHVTGIDLDARKVESIARGVSYIPDVPSETVAALRAQARLDATTDAAALEQADIIFICVPTPFDRMKAPDLSAVKSASEMIHAHLHRDQLIILQSTTFPGTTEEVVQPILERSGLKAGRDFHLAFSPERIDPGAVSSAGWNVKNTPKVLGGLTPRCAGLAEAFLKQLTPEVHLVSSPRAAEMSKLLENIFRSVNIALVNELALLCERMGIDIWEVVDAAKTKPFGYMPFYPSAGVGGHCIAENEFVFVKDARGLRGVRLGEYFSEMECARPDAVRVVGDVKLIEPVGVEILSFDLRKQRACYKPLQVLSQRVYDGTMIEMATTDRRTLSATDGHPMIVWYAGALQIKPACALQAGDELILPTAWPEPTAHLEIDLIAQLSSEDIARTRVAPLSRPFSAYREQLAPALKAWGTEAHEIFRSNRMPLALYLELETRGAMPIPRGDLELRTGRGPSLNTVRAVISINEDFARLIGYYLSEGCITRDKSLRTRLTFNVNEHEYIEDVCRILGTLGLSYSKHKDKNYDALQIKVSSNLFAFLLRDVLVCGTRSTEMQIPPSLLGAPAPIRCALLSGLLRGDGDVDLTQRTRHYYHKGKARFYDHAINVATVGYFSSSPRLFQQTVALAQGLGFVPTFKKDKPYLRLYGEEQLARLTSFFDGAKRAKLERYAGGRRKTMPTKSFIARGAFATVPVREVTRATGTYPVYSVEVEDTHTFITSYGIVTHNCIPVDPYYLSWKAREFDFYTKFIELAAEVNQSMPFHVVNLLNEALNRAGKSLAGARLLVLGVAFKRDIDDARNSPAERIIELLLARGAKVSYHDPHVPHFRVGDNVFHRQIADLDSSPLTSENVASADVVLIVTGHRAVDYQLVVDHARLIVDTTNVTAALDSRAEIVRLGAPLTTVSPRAEGL